MRFNAVDLVGLHNERRYAAPKLSEPKVAALQHAHRRSVAKACQKPTQFMPF
jgi:hypothetical protein